MSDDRYGVCTGCGYVASDYEDARTHLRDAHATSGSVTDIFQKEAQTDV